MMRRVPCVNGRGVASGLLFSSRTARLKKYFEHSDRTLDTEDHRLGSKNNIHDFGPAFSYLFPNFFSESIGRGK
jgi:hypothetical protein